ncbi:MAG: hypothetical protein ACI9XO_002782 [Paraglaciecola sp.]|jgi:hypothetical protein
MKKYTFYLFLTALLCFSCDEENLNNIAENQFVVEAFLYAGQPIDDIRVKTTFPLTDEESTSMPINNAEVTLIKNGERFGLISSGDDGFYHYPNDDVTIETNDVFQLEIVHSGITATGQTTVPTPTTGIYLSQDSLFVPILPFSSGMDSILMAIRSFLTSSAIEAT